MCLHDTDPAVAERGGQGGTSPLIRSGTGRCTESWPPGPLPLVLGPFGDGVCMVEGGPRVNSASGLLHVPLL